MRSFSEAAADSNCEHLRPADLCPGKGHGMQSGSSEGGGANADELASGPLMKQRLDCIALH